MYRRLKKDSPKFYEYQKGFLDRFTCMQQASKITRNDVHLLTTQKHIQDYSNTLKETDCKISSKYLLSHEVISATRFVPLNLPKKFMKLALNINIKYRTVVFSTILTSRKRLWTISCSKRKGRNRIIPVKKIYVLSCVRNRTIQITLLSHLDFNCSHF